MKIKGYCYTCESPFFVYFRKHNCPVCGQRLLRNKVSSIVHSDSPEAASYDFDIADIQVKGNVKFTHVKFFCPDCQKQFTVKEIKKAKKRD